MVDVDGETHRFMFLSRYLYDIFVHSFIHSFKRNTHLGERHWGEGANNDDEEEREQFSPDMKVDKI